MIQPALAAGVRALKSFRFEIEMKKLELPGVDEVSISLIVDNSVDLLLASSDVAKRFKLGANPFEGLLPIAEHGYSVLIRTKRGKSTATVLFDTGVSKKGSCIILMCLKSTHKIFKQLF